MKYLDKIMSVLSGNTEADMSFLTELHDGYDNVAQGYMRAGKTEEACDILCERVLPLRMASFAVLYGAAFKKGDAEEIEKYGKLYEKTEKILKDLDDYETAA